MQYFIHILTDTERIADPDGGEFPDLEAARAEACQSALANELMAGRALSLAWRAQIVDHNDNVILTLPFDRIVGGHDILRRPPSRSHSEAVVRAKAIAERANKSQGEIRGGFEQVWTQLRILGRINIELGGATLNLR
jgi:hypothetical protein